MSGVNFNFPLENLDLPDSNQKSESAERIQNFPYNAPNDLPSFKVKYPNSFSEENPRVSSFDVSWRENPYQENQNQMRKKIKELSKINDLLDLEENKNNDPEKKILKKVKTIPLSLVNFQDYLSRNAQDIDILRNFDKRKGEDKIEISNFPKKFQEILEKFKEKTIFYNEMKMIFQQIFKKFSEKDLEEFDFLFISKLPPLICKFKEDYFKKELELKRMIGELKAEIDGKKKEMLDVLSSEPLKEKLEIMITERENEVIRNTAIITQIQLDIEDFTRKIQRNEIQNKEKISLIENLLSIKRDQRIRQIIFHRSVQRKEHVINQVNNILKFIENAKIANQKLKIEINNLQRIKSEKENKLEILKKECMSLEEKNSVIENKLISCNTEQNNLQMNISSLKNENNEIQILINQLCEQNLAYWGEKTRKKSEISSEEEKTDSKTTNISSNDLTEEIYFFENEEKRLIESISIMKKMTSLQEIEKQKYEKNLLNKQLLLTAYERARENNLPGKIVSTRKISNLPVLILAFFVIARFLLMLFLK